jgi:hypothetical protein
MASSAGLVIDKGYAVRSVTATDKPQRRPGEMDRPADPGVVADVAGMAPWAPAIHTHDLGLDVDRRRAEPRGNVGERGFPESIIGPMPRP